MQCATSLVQDIAGRFSGPLPGKAAQRDMASPDRIDTLFAPAPPDAEEAAVAVLLRPPRGRRVASPPDWSVLLIRRNTYPGVHSGQIAFPGGQREDADKDLWHTACRETREEVGIRTEHMRRLGPLTGLYIPVSNFLVHPFAALLDDRATVRFDPAEVVDGKFVPVRVFDPAQAVMHEFASADGTVRSAPAWNCGDYIVWGATAMILAELYRLLRP
ncbi:MAG: CoA pyrophosphatase [Desulfovibrio sp.]|jgi:8-oxo-dGTP pyrophosphatase MutT (NUDIX family)|nr:CoA pyrophosphatase [Desulfovibrio sp.]